MIIYMLWISKDEMTVLEKPYVTVKVKFANREEQLQFARDRMKIVMKAFGSPKPVDI